MHEEWHALEVFERAQPPNYVSIAEGNLERAQALLQERGAKEGGLP